MSNFDGFEKVEEKLPIYEPCTTKDEDTFFTDMEKVCEKFEAKEAKEPDKVRCRECKHCSNIHKSKYGGIGFFNDCVVSSENGRTTDKLRECKTSLISFNDFLPRFGVFNKSVSVRCTKSPM